MKYILLAFLLIGSARAQTDTISRQSDGLGDSVYIFHVYDTVAVILQVSDTSYYDKSKFWSIDGKPTHDLLWVIKGYKINKNSPSYDGWDCGGNYCIGWQNHWELDSYLDEKKRPLKYFVWLSKQLP